ncbi:hypothetical protein HY945_05665 [Candidatus Gottesmanbacteria bacterium]|nr:hypothetical protein [Candidatus Gottesmanbacteria bacterium]
MTQKKYDSHFDNLKNKWLHRQKELQQGLIDRHKDAFDWLGHRAKQFMVGTIGSLLMFGHPVASTVWAMQPTTTKNIELPDENALSPETRLILDLSYSLPKTVEPLTSEQEKVIAKTLTRHFEMSVTAELQGKRLDRSYGLIGAEQHLIRYPGDIIDTHFANHDEVVNFYDSGMAPGLGAWGYFASSRQAMTQKDVDREKYYIAVQTFLAPGFAENVKNHYDFFKYRKMLVVNPDNGRAMIVDIADAGPSPWTGKHLGGSPEVMRYLDRKDGAQIGPVLYFFIDDPSDTIPLGPTQIKK